VTWSLVWYGYGSDDDESEGSGLTTYGDAKLQGTYAIH